MEIVLGRFRYTDIAITGMLSINGSYRAVSLERPDLDNRQSVSCIPCGTYRIGLRTEGGWHNRDSYHPAIKDVHEGMLEILDVPDRTFILLHRGNKPTDTEGCVLIGSSFGTDTIADSVKAYIPFYQEVLAAVKAGEFVTLRIKEML